MEEVVLFLQQAYSYYQTYNQLLIDRGLELGKEEGEKASNLDVSYGWGPYEKQQ